MSTSQVSRRGFIKTSAAAIAALSVARSAHAAGSDTIKIGMIGCGGRCTGAAHDAMTADPGIKLVAMTDLFLDRVKDKHGVLKKQKPEQVDVTPDNMFSGIDGYKKVIDAVDVVLIACAAKFHPMYVKAAIAAGKHAFCEKPHAIDPYGIKTLMDATAMAKEKKLSILSGLHSRYAPEMKECIQRVQDGQIGDIVSIEENFIRAPYGLVQRRPEGMSELHWQYSCQYRFRWLCGDDVPQSLVHNIDRATWAMKEAVPVKCHGLAGRSSTFDLPYVYGDVFDHHSVVYEYAGGIRVYAFCRTQPNCYNEDSSIILGAKGKAFVKSGRIDGEKPWKFTGKWDNPYVLEHVDFFKAIRDGKPLNCGDYAARSTLVTIMGQLSCYSGQETTWDQMMKSTFAYAPKAEECTWDMEPPNKPDDKGIYPVPIPGKFSFAEPKPA
ncbi:MAG: Gfo/Idh/MocA family oxidoreductase [Tepidisphaeraceae bacterium]|jgi:predicted dehydrogenase